MVYDREKWLLLERLRSRAKEVMLALRRRGLESIVYGSIARGDVKPTSDVDVFIPYPPSPFLVEGALLDAGFEILGKSIVQATPSYALKGYLDLGGNTTVSFPLTRLKRREREFYAFGGKLSLEGLLEGKRVPGVDKRLMMIEPTSKGHVEWSILGREGEAARLLGISIDTVLERVSVLTRRRKVGKTGVFLKWEFPPDKSFEEAIDDLVKRKPEVRKRLRG